MTRFLIFFIFSIFQTLSTGCRDTHVRIDNIEKTMAKKIEILEREISVLRAKDMKTTQHIANLENTVGRQKIEMSMLQGQCSKENETRNTVHLEGDASQLPRNFSGRGDKGVPGEDTVRDKHLSLKRSIFGARSTTSTAFYAYMSSSESSPGPHHTLIFPTVIINVGNSYNRYTGVFSVPVSGLYVYSYSITPDSSAYIPVEIVSNSNVIGSSFARAYSSYRENASSTVVAQLNAGDAIFLRTSSSSTPTGNIYSGSSARTSFCEPVLKVQMEEDSKSSKIIIECIIYYYNATENESPPLAKERQRVQVDLDQPLDQLLKRITESCGLDNAAAKKGLGNNISVTVGRIEKGKEGTKVFSITTDESLRLEKASLIRSPTLQVNVQKKLVTFAKNTPVIQVIYGDDGAPTFTRRQKAGRKRNPLKQEEEELVKRIKRGENIIRGKEQQAIFDAMQTSVSEHDCIAVNEYSIKCGICSRVIVVPIDRSAAKRVEYFRNRHFMKCSSAAPIKTVNKAKEEEGLLKQKNFMSQWCKSKANEHVEKEDTIDSDMDMELASGTIMDLHDRDSDKVLIDDMFDNFHDVDKDEVWLTSENNDSSSDNDKCLSDEHVMLFPLCIEQADDVCVRLNSHIQNHVISTTGILYKFLNDLTQFLENPDHEYDEEVIQFFNTIQYLGGEKTVNFLRGPMWFGSGSGANRPVENVKMNFGGPSHPTRLKHSSGYTTDSGIVKPWLKSLLEIAADKGSSSKPILENELVKVYPVALANDGTALKPGFQFDEEQNLVVGLNTKADYSFVKNNPKPDTEMLRSGIITEANVSYASLIDNTVSLPIAVYYKPKAGKTGIEMKKQILTEVTIVQTCLGCLQSLKCSGEGQIISQTSCDSECKRCIEQGRVCMECADIGHQSTKPPLRACDHCVKDGRQCIRTMVVAVTADCEQGNKNAFAMIINDREAGQLDPSYLFSVLPDAVHVGKSMKASFANWHILLQNERSSLSMLRTLRDNTVEQKRILPRDSVINKDRMDVECILHLTKQEVLTEIEKQESIVHTFVPEKFRLSETNKHGMYPHPIALASSDKGKLFVLDYNDTDNQTRLLELRLHVPVDVTIHKAYHDARSMAVIEDKVYICLHNDGISIFPADAIRLQTSKMKKTDLVDFLTRSGKHANGTVKELKEGVEAHLKELETVYKEKNTDKTKVVLAPKVKPSSITKASNDLLKIACDSEEKIHTVQLKCDGVVVEGTCSPLVPYPGQYEEAISMCVSASQLYVSFSSSQHFSSGIFIYDLAGNVKKKLTSHSDSIKSFYVAPFLDGIVFTDTKEHRIKAYDGQDISDLAGSGLIGNTDGTATSTSFSQPIGIATNFNSVVVADANSGSIRIISKVDGMIKFLTNLGKLYSAFGVHLRHKENPRLKLSEAVGLVASTNSYVKEHVAHVKQLINTEKTTNGPEGTISAKTANSISVIYSELQYLESLINSLNANYPAQMQTLLTVAVENLHAISHFKDDTQTMLQYARNLGNTVFEGLKRYCLWSAFYFTHRGSYYPVPESKMKLRKLPRLNRTKNKYPLSLVQKMEMREWVNENGKCMRQRSVRQETTKFKAGTLPLNLYVTNDKTKKSNVNFPDAYTQNIGDVTRNQSEEIEDELASEYESDDEEVMPVTETDFLTSRPDCLSFMLGFRSRSGRCVRVTSKFD